ncbi:MAG TPA: tRNA (adenosine(37)-N6)-dimethylallyltransferase MiaA [Gemmatimonadales bacterium]|nr:tRNA (adenosine(37)-N6)-dimethylallyltransferase MiaA [Gemmatimonadales bacterium]
MAGARTPVILGPTGIGKTAVAYALAAHWPLEVVSADSRQIYRLLDIGTAKPPRRWLATVPHHGLDLVRPGERYSAGRFGRQAPGWIAEIAARGKMPVVVGGTGLYVKTLTEGLFAEPPLDPGARRELERWTAGLEAVDLVRWAGRLDPGFKGGGRQRASRAIEVALLTGKPLSYWQAVARSQGAITPWYVVLTAPRPVLHQRIQVRAEEMVRRGMIEEVAAVLAEGTPADAPGLDAIGPREAVEYLHGQRSRESVAGAVAVASRQYAKRQETWFRHQLEGPVLTLDATRPPEEVAAVIAEKWRGAGAQGHEAPSP